MTDLSLFKGPQSLNKAYQTMLENDAHAPGSVDQVLIANLIRLCDTTATYLYSEYTPLRSCFYEHGTRYLLEKTISSHIDNQSSDEQRIESIAIFTSMLGIKNKTVLSEMVLGGTEEELIDRGSSWCADIARVACILYQISGFPSRIVFLLNLQQAYSGHVIVEVNRNGVWGAVDPSCGLVFRNAFGNPASTWILMNSPNLIEIHSSPSTPSITAEQFTSAGISNYFIRDAGRYDFTTSKLNEYYKSILTQSQQGWPGGIRWLFNEDDS